MLAGNKTAVGDRMKHENWKPESAKEVDIVKLPVSNSRGKHRPVTGIRNGLKCRVSHRRQLAEWQTNVYAEPTSPNPTV